MKNTKKILLLTLLLFLVAPNLALAKLYPVKDIIPGISGLKVIDKERGQSLWQSNILTAKVSSEGKWYIYREDNGWGIWGKDKKYKQWLTKAYFIREGEELFPYSINWVLKDIKGKVLRKVEKYYDRKQKKVFVTVDGKGQEFDFKADLVDKENLSYVLSNFPWGKKKEAKFLLLTHEPTVYKMTKIGRASCRERV